MTITDRRPPPAPPNAPLAVRYGIHGIGIVVESVSSVAADAVDASYGSFRAERRVGSPPDLHVTLRRSERGYRLTGHDGTTEEVGRESTAVVGLFDLVIRAALDGLARRGILGLHAGAVAFGGGGAILAGASGRGKSTLTLGLLRRGADLLSDEMALVAPDDRTLLPYPRSAHVRDDTLALLPELAGARRRPRYDLGGGSEWSVSASDVAAAFGAGIAEPVPIRAIALLDGQPDPERRPSLTPVGPAIAALELARGTPAAATDFTGTLRRLTTATREVPCARLAVGRLDATVDLVAAWLDGGMA